NSLMLTVIIGLSTANAQMIENNPPLDTLKNINLMVIDSLQIPDTLYDVVDLFKDINPIRDKSKENFSKKRSPISYLPNINYNPSIGFQIGVKAVGGEIGKRRVGKECRTRWLR